jgi:hypothetical protein
MGSTWQGTSWIVEAVRRREGDLADACAIAATHIRDAVVAGRLAGLVFEHARHARPEIECTNTCAPEIDTATLRARARRTHAQPDTWLDAAIDGAVSGAIARAHAETALFIDDVCGTLLVAPEMRERLLRVAFCTAAMGQSLWEHPSAPGPRRVPAAGSRDP